VIGAHGELIGIGFAAVSEQAKRGRPVLNMVVDRSPGAIFDDLLALAARPSGAALARLLCTEVEDRIIVAGLAGGAPARRAGSPPAISCWRWPATK